MSDPAEMRALLSGVGSRMCRVVFIKRTTDERRSMTFRLGVKKGVDLSIEYDPELARQDLQNDLIRVWDVEIGKLYPKEPERAYRFVSLERVLSIKCGEIRYPAPRGRK